MMKLALFVVCALVAVQGFQASPVQSAEDRTVGDIIGQIRDIVEQIRTIIDELREEIPQLIVDVRERIQEIIQQAEDIAQEIAESIRDIIQTAGEIGRRCVGAQEEEIQALGELATNGMTDCAADARDGVEPLREQVDRVVNDGIAVREDIVSRTVQCIEDSGSNPIRLVICLRRQLQPIRAQLDRLRREVESTVALARETAAEVSVNLAQCVLEVRNEVAQRQRVILENISQCIADSVDESS